VTRRNKEERKSIMTIDICFGFASMFAPLFESQAYLLIGGAVIGGRTRIIRMTGLTGAWDRRKLCADTS